jgi:beta-lactamase class A
LIHRELLSMNRTAKDAKGAKHRCLAPLASLAVLSGKMFPQITLRHYATARRRAVRGATHRQSAARGRWIGSLLLVALLLAPAARAEPTSAPAYLASIQPSADLQRFLDQTVDALLASDPALRRVELRVALLDLGDPQAPRLAQRRGGEPIYPASVIKFVYLMAAYAQQERGALQIDAELDDLITHMIRESSNQATQGVVARLTGTQPGPELPPAEYVEFKQRRLTVDAWLRSLGIDDLHCVNPTYDGSGDVSGREAQLLKDRSAGGTLVARGDEFANRNAMTADGTVKLLALLATDRALSPADSETVRRRMRRDPKEQPHLAARIAGGAARIPGLQVYAKSGTWGPIYADAGIVRAPSGRQFALAVFTQGTPPYRGDFIAELTYRAAVHLLSHREGAQPAGRTATE